MTEYPVLGSLRVVRFKIFVQVAFFSYKNLRLHTLIDFLYFYLQLNFAVQNTLVILKHMYKVFMAEYWISHSSTFLRLEDLMILYPSYILRLKRYLLLD